MKHEMKQKARAITNALHLHFKIYQLHVSLFNYFVSVMNNIFLQITHHNTQVHSEQFVINICMNIEI
jgi:hypothetical protein